MNRITFCLLFVGMTFLMFGQDVPKDEIAVPIEQTDLPEKVDGVANDIETLVGDVKEAIDALPKKINTAQDLMDWLHFLGIILTILLTQLAKVKNWENWMDRVRARYKLIAIAIVAGLSLTVLKGELGFSAIVMNIFITAGGAMIIFETVKELPLIKKLFNDKGAVS